MDELANLMQQGVDRDLRMTIGDLMVQNIFLKNQLAVIQQQASQMEQESGKAQDDQAESGPRNGNPADV